MLNIISFIVLLICTWVLVASNIGLLRKNERLIDTNDRLLDALNYKNHCIDELMDVLVQHQYFDKNTFKSLYNAAYGYLVSDGYDMDGIQFDITSFKLFEILMKSKGYKRPIDDIFFVDHDEYIPFEYDGDSYVIEVFW